MFQAQKLIVLEKLLCPSRSLWRRALQDRVLQHNARPARRRPRPIPIFWSQTGLVSRPTVSDHITDNKLITLASLSLNYTFHRVTYRIDPNEFLNAVMLTVYDAATARYCYGPL